MNMKTILSSLLLLSVAITANAERYKYENSGKGNNDNPPAVAANCTPATAATELDINNTRALIQSGGDMWWDFNRARYEIPKNTDKTSLFAGSLWLAGQDISGQFKVAALRFRQVGNDYWTGPLSTVDAEIDAQTCKDYDRHWETTRSMVAEFAAWWEAGQFDSQNGTNTQEELYEGYSVPAAIMEWPAHGRNFEPYNEDYYLAPFYDRDGGGDYDPIGDGDYPSYVLSGKSDCSRRVRDIYGDQNLWWVFNDKGNIHTESGGQSIGMEIRAQAFAFATTDEVNNMTFYNYELINRSTFELSETYFGQWVDPDLGNAQDDYVGCDVRRGLGYVYNGDDEDQDAGGNLGYGTQPPALGVDFFQGPFQANDGFDNCLCDSSYAEAKAEDGIVYSGQGAGYGDGIVDNERYGMRKFLYHNNAAGPIGDPNIATDYYNMLRGIWKDGTPMTFGGNGYAPADPNAIPAHYMFPGDTDPLNWGTDGVAPDASLIPWTEVSSENPPGDRRFIQSSGPFRLGPGAVNNITVGVVWMQATSGGPLQSVEDMRRADDKTQALFDSCFEILDGPDAPDVTVQELDKEIILMLSNPLNSNNYNEQFAAVDPFLASPDSIDTDGDGVNDVRLTVEEKQIYSTYVFEGYQIYQLADASVGTNDLEDPDKARLVDQVDIANDIDRLINFEFNSQIGQDEPKIKVDGENKGIRHSYQITTDLFSTDDSRLVNHKTYYFMVIAYAYNKFGDGYGNLSYLNGEYDPSADPPLLDGQKLPYLASRKSPSGPVRVIEAIPHKTESEFGGISTNAEYGDGVEVTRIEGRGNGGSFAQIKEDYLDSLMSLSDVLGEWIDPTLGYEAGYTPISLKVVDPLVIKPGDFTVKFIDTTLYGDLDNLTWVIYERGNTVDPIDTIYADQTVRQNNEQVLFDLGLSLTIGPGYSAGHDDAIDNGYLGFSIAYDDETDQWLGGVPDIDADPEFNWIKSGDYYPDAQATLEEAEADCFLDAAHEVPCDPGEDWEIVANRTWAPYALASFDTAHPVAFFDGTPLFAQNARKFANLENTPSVDIYFTTDKSKWTRCPVFESGEFANLNEGIVTRGELRRGLSVDKEGLNQLDEGVNYDEATHNGTQLIGDALATMRQGDIDHFKLISGYEDDADLEGLSYGMGWFPGYAVDVETGERLNMAFSENSWLGSENGADMQWNPTDKIMEDLFGELRLGGMHMIYVFRNNVEDAGFISDDLLMPSYDNGDFAFSKLNGFDPEDATLVNPNDPHVANFNAVMRSCGWVGYPIVNQNMKLFGESGENGVTIRLRASRPYSRYVAPIEDNPTTSTKEETNIVSASSITEGSSYYVANGSVTVKNEFSYDSAGIVKTVVDDIVFSKGEGFRALEDGFISEDDDLVLLQSVNNGGLPLYNFSTHKVAPTLSSDIGETALDDIRAVPNPYYAYSEYETGRLDYRVKIINLPQTCTVNIFTVDGTLVRRYEKDDPTVSSIDWDLKNQDNITIASGLYIIHVEVPGLGEKIVKWFGVLRPIDLNSF